MSDELSQQLDKLVRAVTDLDRATRRALGFIGTLQFQGITFNISRRFVLADMSPLAFFQMGEHIRSSAGETDSERDTAEKAVGRLYERLVPLLSCQHQWTPLSRAEDQHKLSLSVQTYGSTPAHVCKACTAYALEGSLPAVGREFA
jgi:hypothetical protein